MTKEELEVSKRRKENMHLYTIHEMITADLLFYYSIEVLFLTQVKNISMQYILIAAAMYRISKIILQIPVNLVLEKLGIKNSIIIGDILIGTSILMILIGDNIATLILSYIIMAFGFLLGSLSSDLLITLSVPNVSDNNNILAKIYGKGMGNYFYISAITSIISGFLFNINGYIPMIISALTYFIAARLACMFNKVSKENEKKTEDSLNRNYKNYLVEIKNSFDYILNSRRLKSLMIFAGLMFGVITVIETYQIDLLNDIGLSATLIGIIYAIMQIICGIAAKNQHKFHNKFKNITLSIIGMVFVLSCLFAGIVSIFKINTIVMALIIIILFSTRSASTGLYYVLIKKYISNFTNEKIVAKIYTAYNLVTSLSSFILEMVASIIIAKNSIGNSIIIFGVFSTVAMVATLYNMKNKVGLKPSQYKKEEISYKEYIKSKNNNED